MHRVEAWAAEMRAVHGSHRRSHDDRMKTRKCLWSSLRGCTESPTTDCSLPQFDNLFMSLPVNCIHEIIISHVWEVYLGTSNKARPTCDQVEVFLLLSSFYTSSRARLRTNSQEERRHAGTDSQKFPPAKWCPTIPSTALVAWTTTVLLDYEGRVILLAFRHRRC